ncbi:MAG: hypothetical protein AAGD25_15150 [Cyanobacteria bacterium P01_F01_bin.150]
MDLLSSSSNKPLRQRVDGAIIRKDFTKAVKDCGGDADAQADSTVAMNQELFDCNPKELYQQTGAKRNQRATLPHEAQKALIVGETVATHDLKAANEAGEFEGSQPQVNQKIEGKVRESSKKVRKLFPW